MFTSLSTSTAAFGRCAWNRGGTATRSHPGMIGGFTTRPAAYSTGPGSPTPTPSMAASGRSIALHELGDPLHRPFDRDVRTDPDVELVGVLHEQLARAVGDRESAVGGAEVRRDHDAAVGIEGEPGRRSSAGGRPVPGLDDQPHADQRVHPLGHGRPGHAGVPGEVAARRDAAPHQLQHGTGAGGARHRRQAGPGPPGCVHVVPPDMKPSCAGALCSVKEQSLLLYDQKTLV